jgi:hypothetical protein
LDAPEDSPTVTILEMYPDAAATTSMLAEVRDNILKNQRSPDTQTDKSKLLKR